MNHKSVRLLEDFKKDFTDPKIKNNPKFAIMFMISNEGIIYERRVYTIFDLLGKVGGFAGALEFIVLLLVFTFTSNHTDTMTISTYTNSIVKINSIDDLSKDVETLEQIKKLSFQLLLFVWKKLLCGSRFVKLKFSPDTRKNLEFFESSLEDVSQSLALNNIVRSYKIVQVEQQKMIERLQSKGDIDKD